MTEDNEGGFSSTTLQKIIRAMNNEELRIFFFVALRKILILFDLLKIILLWKTRSAKLNIEDILDLVNIKKGLALAKPKDFIKLKTFRNNSGEKLSFIVLCALSSVK
ncbi:hypothetical protein [Clostridium cochlearium]|uniref:hypothetical protein n=2 Tax=Clostridium cochlearium TaxID=1494 RepID=UPI000B949E7F|nr:hypothetical protein [Clostridium cochlearium]SNV81617.1 Uncharacterised protein [Clostridium cochlearium]STA92947.1 Uncharacterised protein [Clostridium cochlearium]